MKVAMKLPVGTCLLHDMNSEFGNSIHQSLSTIKEQLRFYRGKINLLTPKMPSMFSSIRVRGEAPPRAHIWRFT